MPQLPGQAGPIRTCEESTASSIARNGSVSVSGGNDLVCRELERLQWVEGSRGTFESKRTLTSSKPAQKLGLE